MKHKVEVHTTEADFAAQILKGLISYQCMNPGGVPEDQNPYLRGLKYALACVEMSKNMSAPTAEQPKPAEPKPDDKKAHGHPPYSVFNDPVWFLLLSLLFLTQENRDPEEFAGFGGVKP